MGAPLNHPFMDHMDGFSIVNHPFWGTPMTMETPKWMYITIVIGVISQLIGDHNCSYKRRTGPRSPRRWLLPSCPQIETLKRLGRFTCLYSMAISGTYIGGTLPYIRILKFGHRVIWNWEKRIWKLWFGNYEVRFGNWEMRIRKLWHQSDSETQNGGFGNYDLETKARDLETITADSETMIGKLWFGNYWKL